jgi:hypothetical protein
VQLSELDKIIAETRSEDWEITVAMPPTFLYTYKQGREDGRHSRITEIYKQQFGEEGRRITDIQEHRSIAVLKADIDIRIAWGFDPTFGQQPRWALFKEDQISNRSVNLQLADVFYRGAIVRRYELLSVDSDNAILPRPVGRLKDGASWGSSTFDDVERVVSQREVNFARLVHEFDAYEVPFEHYLGLSGFVVEPT